MTVSGFMVAAIVSMIIIALGLLIFAPTVYGTIAHALDVEARNAFGTFKETLILASAKVTGTTRTQLVLSEPGHYIISFTFNDTINKNLINFAVDERMVNKELIPNYRKQVFHMENLLEACPLDKECLCIVQRSHAEEDYITNRYALYTTGASNYIDPFSMDDVDELIVEDIWVDLNDTWGELTAEFEEQFINPLGEDRYWQLDFISCSLMEDFSTCNKCSIIDPTYCESITGCSATGYCKGHPLTETSSYDEECIKIKKRGDCVGHCGWLFTGCQVDNDEIKDMDPKEIIRANPLLIADLSGSEKYRVSSLAAPFSFENVIISKPLDGCYFFWEHSAKEVLVGINKNVSLDGRRCSVRIKGGDYADKAIYNKQGAHQACKRQFDGQKDDGAEEYTAKACKYCRGEVCEDSSESWNLMCYYPNDECNGLEKLTEGVDCN